MTDTAFTAQDIATFLQEHPGFFDQHADVFATLQVPHPHGSRAISLGERQILTPVSYTHLTLPTKRIV